MYEQFQEHNRCHHQIFLTMWSKHEIIDNLVQENLGGYDITLKTLASKNKIGFKIVYFVIK